MHEKIPHPAVTALEAFAPLPLAALFLSPVAETRVRRRALIAAACFSLAAFLLAAAAASSVLPGWREILLSFALLALAFLFIPLLAFAFTTLLRVISRPALARGLLELAGVIALLPAPLLALLAGLLLTRAGFPPGASFAMRFVLGALIASLLPAWALAVSVMPLPPGEPLLPALAAAFPSLGPLAALGCIGVEAAFSLPGLGALAWSALAAGSPTGLLLPLAFIVIFCLSMGLRAMRLAPCPDTVPAARAYPAGDSLAIVLLLLSGIAAAVWLLLPPAADLLRVYQPPSPVLPWGADHLGIDARQSVIVIAACLLVAIAAAVAARRLVPLSFLTARAHHLAIFALPVLLLAGALLSALPAPIAALLFGLLLGLAAALFPGQGVLFSALALLAPFFFGHLFPAPPELLAGALLSPASGFTGLSARLSLPFFLAVASFSLTFVQTRNKS